MSKNAENLTCVEIEGKNYDFSIDDYGQKIELGGGGGGTVFLAESEGKRYAIKEYKISSGKSEKSKNKTIRNEKEVDFLCHLNNDCPNIIKIYGHEIVNKKLFIVMDVYPNTLRKVIKQKNSVEVLFSYIFQLVNAVKYIHGKNIYHRDIKPENILVDQNNTVVLCDFGIAHFPDENLTKPDDFLANANYMSPEAHYIGNSCNVTSAIDIYPLGKIINEMFTRENPVGTNFTKISDYYPELSELDALVDRMMDQIPEKRPKIDAVAERLHFIKELYDKNVKELKQLVIDFSASDLINDDVARIAAEDIHKTNQIYKYLNYDQIRKLNHNYHSNIHYSTEEDFRNYYFQYLLLDKCIIKFNSESNGLNSDWDSIRREGLVTSENYKRLNDILSSKNTCPYGFVNIKGQVLKYFASCYDYHCDELIEECKRIQEKVDDLIDVPIWYFLIKTHDCFKRFCQIDEVNFVEYLSCNFSESNEELIENSLRLNLPEEKRNKIIDTLKDEYLCDIEDNGEHVSALFSVDMFKRFENTVLDNAQKYQEEHVDEKYIIYDAKDIVRKRDNSDSFILIRLDNYDIDSVLFKVLYMH